MVDVQCIFDIGSECVIVLPAIENRFNLISKPVLAPLALVAALFVIFPTDWFAEIFPHRPTGQAYTARFLGKPVHECKNSLHAKHKTVRDRQASLFDNRTEELVVALVGHAIPTVVRKDDNGPGTHFRRSSRSSLPLEKRRHISGRFVLKNTTDTPIVVPHFQ
jgi:hypothetical protein